MKCIIIFSLFAFSITIFAKAERKKTKLISPKIPEKCKNIKCPAVERPLCVKVKHLKHSPNHTMYVLMVNQCELEYMKCHQDVEGLVVPMKYCRHQPSKLKPPKGLHLRAKRHARFDQNTEVEKNQEKSVTKEKRKEKIKADSITKNSSDETKQNVLKSTKGDVKSNSTLNKSKNNVRRIWYRTGPKNPNHIGVFFSDSDDIDGGYRSKLKHKGTGYQLRHLEVGDEKAGSVEELKEEESNPDKGLADEVKSEQGHGTVDEENENKGLSEVDKEPENDNDDDEVKNDEGEDNGNEGVKSDIGDEITPKDEVQIDVGDENTPKDEVKTDVDNENTSKDEKVDTDVGGENISKNEEVKTDVDKEKNQKNDNDSNEKNNDDLSDEHQEQVADNGDKDKIDEPTKNAASNINSEKMFEDSVNDEAMFDEGKIHDEKLNEEKIHDEKLNDEKIHDVKLNDEKIHDETLHDEKIHDEKLHDEKIHDEKLHDEKIHDVKLHDKKIHDKPIHDKPLHDRPIHDKPLHDKPMFSEPMFASGIEIIASDGADENENLKDDGKVDNGGNGNYFQGGGNAADKQTNWEKNEEDCPEVCPQRKVMVCGRCLHGVYRTFLSVCHLRMFACHNTDENMELVSRLPCAMSAPYIALDLNMEPQGEAHDPADDDRVLRFIKCREKGMLGGQVGELALSDRYQDPDILEAEKKCRFD